MGAKRRRVGPAGRNLLGHPDTHDQGRRMLTCSELIKYFRDPDAEGPPEWLLAGAQFCQVRTCPICEWRKAMAWRRRMAAGLVKFEEAFPTHKAALLTLTVKNVPILDLNRTIREMHRGWQRLNQWKDHPTKFWLRRTEVTLGKPSMSDELPDGRVANGRLRPPKGPDLDDPTVDDEGFPAIPQVGGLWAHPHIHALLLVPASYWGRNYIKHAEWRQQWAMAMRLDYDPVVDIRRAYVKEGNDQNMSENEAATRECMKYVCKSQEIVKLGPMAPEFYLQLKGQRMVAVSHKLQQFVAPEEPTKEEMLDIAATREMKKSWPMQLYRWDNILDQYIRTP